jgi:hypothetical protein
VLPNRQVFLPDPVRIRYYWLTFASLYVALWQCHILFSNQTQM